MSLHDLIPEILKTRKEPVIDTEKTRAAWREKNRLRLRKYKNEWRAKKRKVA